MFRDSFLEFVNDVYKRDLQNKSVRGKNVLISYVQGDHKQGRSNHIILLNLNSTKCDRIPGNFHKIFSEIRRIIAINFGLKALEECEFPRQYELRSVKS